MNKKNISLGVSLIVIGVIWLLSDLNVIDFSFRYILDGILELWPIILIIIGVNIIFKNDILNNVLWVLFFITVIFYGSYIQKNYDYNRDISDEDISIELEQEIENGELDLNIGATSFEIGEESKEYAVFKHNGQFNHKITESNNTKSLFIENKKGINYKDRSSNLFVGLNNNIPWNIDIDSGASKGNLDFKNIIVEELDVDIGAESLKITLGNKSSNTNIDIDAGASSIDINIPNNSGVKIRIDGALNSTNFKDLNLVEEGKYLITEGFDDSPNKFYIDVDMGVGSFNINYY